METKPSLTIKISRQTEMQIQIENSLKSVKFVNLKRKTLKQL